MFMKSCGAGAGSCYDGSEALVVGWVIATNANNPVLTGLSHSSVKEHFFIIKKSIHPFYRNNG